MSDGTKVVKPKPKPRSSSKQLSKAKMSHLSHKIDEPVDLTPEIKVERTEEYEDEDRIVSEPVLYQHEISDLLDIKLPELKNDTKDNEVFSAETTSTKAVEDGESQTDEKKQEGWNDEYEHLEADLVSFSNGTFYLQEDLKNGWQTLEFKYTHTPMIMHVKEKNIRVKPFKLSVLHKKDTEKLKYVNVFAYQYIVSKMLEMMYPDDYDSSYSRQNAITIGGSLAEKVALIDLRFQILACKGIVAWNKTGNNEMDILKLSSAACYVMNRLIMSTPFSDYLNNESMYLHVLLSVMCNIGNQFFGIDDSIDTQWFLKRDIHRFRSILITKYIMGERDDALMKSGKFSEIKNGYEIIDDSSNFEFDNAGKGTSTVDFSKILCVTEVNTLGDFQLDKSPLFVESVIVAEKNKKRTEIPGPDLLISFLSVYCRNI